MNQRNIFSRQNPSKTVSKDAKMGEIMKKYRCFSCSTMQRQLANRKQPTATCNTYSESLYASVCLADISGFTKLSAKLSAEELKVHINEYFTMLLTVIRQNHGDVIKFLGDAVLILWPIDKDASEEVQAAATTMACLCALQLLKDCGNYDRGEGENKVELRLHCGVVCGVIHTLCVGEGDRWEYIVSGEPLKAVGEAESEAEKGECCLSPEAYAKVSDHFEAVLMPKGSYRLTGALKPTSSISTKYLEILHINRSEPSTKDESHYPQLSVDHISSAYSLTAAFLSAETPDSGHPEVDINELLNLLPAPSQPPPEVVPTDHPTESMMSSSKMMQIFSSVAGSGTSTPDSQHSHSPRHSSYKADDQTSTRHPSLKLDGDVTSTRKVNSCRVTDVAERDAAKTPFAMIRQIISREEPYIVVTNFLKGFLTTDDLNDDDYDEIMSNPEFCPILRNFVHNAARAAIENGTDEYLPELRHVVTIFVEILEMDDDLYKGLLDRPQKALSAMLEVLKNFGGSLRQYVVDDKGCVMIAAFGLSDSSHEDNCVRAVEVAVALRPRFTDIGIKCHIGISEGKVYCGVVGSITDRCEYAMMGLTVNLAARLMCKCAADEIRVSETVHEAACVEFDFLELDRVQAKGFANLVRVFRPEQRANTNALNAKSEDCVFVGRRDLVLTFMKAIKSVSVAYSDHRADSKSDLTLAYIIQGGPGSGKTRLAGEILKRSKKLHSNMNAVVAHGSSSHTHTTYYVVRQLLEHIFDIKIKHLLVENTRKKIMKLKATKQNQQRPPTADQEPAEKVDEDGVLLSIRTWLEKNGLAGTPLHEQDLPEINHGKLSSANGIVEVETFFKYASSSGMIDQWKSKRSQTETDPGSPNPFASQQSVELTPQPLSPTPSLKAQNQKPRLANFIMNRKKDLLQQNRNENNSSATNGQTRLADIVMNNKKTLMMQNRNNSRTPAFQSQTINQDDGGYTLIDLIPLLGDIFSLPFAETPVTKKMSQAERVRVREALIVRLLLVGIDAGYSLILVDNLHQADMQSLLILLRLVRSMTKGLFIGIRRFVELNKSQLIKKSEAQLCYYVEEVFSKLCTVVDLPPLNIGDVKEMMKHIIPAKYLQMVPQAISQENVRKLHAKGSGSPLSSLSLAKELRSALEHNTFTTIDALTLAHNDVVARIDQLSDIEKVVLKTASIIGERFFENELKYTLELEHQNCVNVLEASLHKLIGKNLITKSTDKEGLEVYTFTTQVREEVYELMMGDMREKYHGVVAEYMEIHYFDVPDRFDGIVYHYMKSDVFLKKIEYLEYGAVKADHENRHQEVCQYYGMLIKLATGLEPDLLLNACCRKVAHDNGTLTHIQGSRLQRQASHALEAAVDRDVVFYSNWIFRNQLKKALHLAPGTVAKLRQASATTDLNQHRVSLFVAKMAIAEGLQGRLCESNSWLNVAFFNIGIKMPRLMTLRKYKNRQKLKRFICDILRPKVPVVGNHEELDIYLNMITLQACFFMLHGLAVPAIEVLEIGYRLISNYHEWHANTVRRNDADEDANERAHELFLHKFNILMAVAQTASDHTALAKQYVLELTESARKGELDSEHDPIILTCRSILIAAYGDFKLAAEIIAVAPEPAPAMHHMHHIAVLQQAWLLMLSGDLRTAETLVLTLYETCTSSTLPLYFWAQELEIMLRTSHEDYSGAEAVWTNIRLKQRERRMFSPSTAAVVAFSLTQNKKYQEAHVYTLYALKKLTDRQLCNVTSGVMLFCALYAALDICESDPAKKLVQFASTPLGKAFRAGSQRLDKMCSRFPCVVLLNQSIVARYYRLFDSLIDPTAASTVIDVVAYIDGHVHSVRRNLESFVFGCAFFHLQRTKLCEKLGIPGTFMRTIEDDSLQLAVENLRTLGLPTRDLASPEVLERLQRKSAFEVRVDSDYMPFALRNSTVYEDGAPLSYDSYEFSG